MSEKWRETYDQWKLATPPEYEGLAWSLWEREEEDLDDLDRYDEDEPEDEYTHDCGDPECCMNFAPHFRSECYTPEMYEAMVEECTADQTEGAQS